MIVDIDAYSTKLKELDDILIENNLGYIYDFENDIKNGLVLPFYLKNMDAVQKFELKFCVTTDQSARAGILYRHSLIFVSYGIFDRLCKLALLIHSSGVLSGKIKEFTFVDLHLVENPFVGFSLEDANERSESETHLFLFIFDSLLSFVIFHEIGHHVNKHGVRSSLSDDIEGHRNIHRCALIKSHARELVADNFSFRYLRRDIELLIDSENPIIQELLPVFKCEKGAATLALLFVACYFKLMDGTAPKSHFESTHPESAIRVHSIFSTYLEPYMDTSEINSYEDPLTVAIMLLHDVFKYKDGSCELNWMGRAITPEMKEWFSDICVEYPKWCV